MSKIKIDKLEFYITNVCNLTCSGCNRYNNYKFAGWQNFDDYEEILTQWATKIDIVKPVILGGEPLLNPSVTGWIRGLRRLWPDHYSPQIQSNGTRIDQVDGLYEACLQTESWIGISIHDSAHVTAIFDRIRNFLTAPIQETADAISLGSDYQFVDANCVQVHVWMSDHFVQNNLLEGPPGRFRLYHSDPVRAHDICTFVKNKNYHFIDGSIHKCGPAPLMQQFDRQFDLDLDDLDRELLHAYRGLSVQEFDQRGQEFFRTIDEPIAQCKFCPESYDWKKIEFSSLKPNKI